MARPELGTKRVCPTTGRKFYDLNRDPIVSPYTGEVLARSLLEPAPPAPRAKPEPEEDKDETELRQDGPETVSLDDAAAEEEAASGSDDADIGEEEEASPSTDDDVFLEEEEEGGDVADLVDSDIEDDEET